MSGPIHSSYNSNTYMLFVTIQVSFQKTDRVSLHLSGRGEVCVQSHCLSIVEVLTLPLYMLAWCSRYNDGWTHFQGLRLVLQIMSHTQPVQLLAEEWC